MPANRPHPTAGTARHGSRNPPTARLSSPAATPPPPAGIIGEGIAKSFLEQGATVVANARSVGSKPKIEAALGGVGTGKLLVPVADHGKLEGAEALAAFIKESVGGQVDHVISISGGES